ncbi:hypothetical protein [Pandoraea sp. ISTKB]|uniref:hypothetical protein n=1 Tax=Pandoraea sp. ISTKB TaxID=1586708 RepID=UPI000846E0DF|nr:hypothetical protein [Pandoraea sp. ISTKB]
MIEQFWRRVAHELAVPSAQILNDVGAQMIGERSWSALLARSPIKASEPFYRFLVDPSNKAGHFQLSLPGYALADELNSLSDMGREPHPEELAEAEEWARSITLRRPDFLDAGLFLAELVAINDVSEASKILDDYIARSEALIPTEFRGKIDWLYDGNRTYLRMLYLRMEMAYQTADIARSIKLARKLLKLCPNDNQGVRYDLPLLLLIKGNIASATRSIRAFAHERGYIGTPIRAFVAYANGDIKSFRVNLLEALFYWPGFRRFIEGNPSEFGQTDTDRRGKIIDMEEFAQLAWPVLVGIPGLKQASMALIGDDQVRLAEARLRDLWHGFFRNPTPNSSREQWSKSIDHYVNVLS